jgi:hypothetical protein
MVEVRIENLAHERGPKNLVQRSLHLYQTWLILSEDRYASLLVCRCSRAPQRVGHLAQSPCSNRMTSVLVLA